VWNRPEKGALAQWVLALEELAVKLKIAAAGPPGAGMTVGIFRSRNGGRNLEQ
jgi:hypothetical protein